MRKILLLLFILFVLFISSGQSYEQQSLIPTLQNWLPGKPFEFLLSKLQIPYWGITVSVEERGYYYFIEFLLRKAAHIFIFGFLALAIYAVLPKRFPQFRIAAFLTFLLAIADEYHQSLTGGRTPSIQDVFLDTAGAISALLFLQVFLFLRNKRHKKLKKTR